MINILLGFGCHVLAFDKYPDKALEKRDGVQYVELDELLRNSDIVSLHAPLTPETHHTINERTVMTFNLFPPGQTAPLPVLIAKTPF